MNLNEAIEARYSRRNYLPTSLDPEVAAQLQQLIARYSQDAGARIELVLDNGTAFEGLRRNYGMFKGVRHYLGLIHEKDDAASAERLGYYGELLVLHAVTLGLGTCWVSGTFDRKACPFSLSGSETILSTVVLGNVEQGESSKEKFIRNRVSRKRKPIEEMLSADTAAPDWLLSGMRAVQLAPSASNRQPVLFSYEAGHLSAGTAHGQSTSYALDLGIAKCNFEIGAGGGTWSWGNNAEFTRHEA